MDFLSLNQKKITEINTEVEQLTNFQREDNPYNELVPQQYGKKQNALAEQTVNRAIHDNQIIGYALQNSSQFNLDVSQKAKLKSMRGRNLSHILLNSERYRKDSPLMENVKNAVEDVETTLNGPLWMGVQIEKKDKEDE